MIKKIIFALLTFVAVPCAAQTDVKAFLSGTAEGVTYYLPKTTVEITVETECVTRTPGEFHRYADKYLRINNVIAAEEKFWEMKNISIKETGSPDKAKMFTVKLNSSTASNISLTDDGIIEAINTKLPAKECAATTAQHSTPKSDAKQYMTEEILQATSTAKMAELVAKEIYSIRESKLAITRGQSENMPKDGVSLQLILDELAKQEKALMELFTGTTDTTRVSRTVRFTPSSESDTTKAILFRFSRKLGVVEKENLAGAPIYYDFRNLHSVRIPTAEEVKKKEIKKEGICYNIPGKAAFKVYTAGKVFYNEEIPVAQLGVTEVLAKTLFSKSANTKVIFDTATGGVISIDK